MLLRDLLQGVHYVGVGKRYLEDITILKRWLRPCNYADTCGRLTNNDLFGADPRY